MENHAPSTRGNVEQTKTDGDEVKQYFKTEGTVSEWWDPEEKPGLFRDLYIQQREIVRMFAEPREKVILDAGTGKGRFAADLAKAGATRVYATDISDEMLGIARRRASQAGVDAIISFQNMDVENLAYEDDFFDVAICMETFVHLPSPQRAMDELARVAKRGGRIICSVTLPSKKWYLNAGRVSSPGQLFEWFFTPFYHSRIYQGGLRRILRRPRLVGRPYTKEFFLSLFDGSGLGILREIYLGHPRAPHFLVVIAEKPLEEAGPTRNLGTKGL